MAPWPGAKGDSDPLDRYPRPAAGADPLDRYRPATSGTPTDDAQKAKRRKTAIILICVGAVLAFAMGYNPPSPGIHDFTKASDYRDTKDSGCTNSGKGCHGSESAYNDFNAYHPDSTCNTCHEYTGIGCIPCHKPTQHECSSCHDGTTPGVVDRTPISAAYPKGHYRETSHTALATDMTREVRTVEEGKAAATCADCHSRDLKTAHTGVPVVEDSPYGDSIGCGECHNDTRLQAVKQVTSKWKKRDCAICHAEASLVPMHDARIATAVAGEGVLECGSTGDGCHTDNDIHSVHRDAPEKCSGSAAKGEPGCHDLKVQASKPTAKTCGAEADACHDTYLNDDYSHEKDTAVHSPKTLSPASDISYYDTACGDCHRMDPDGTSLVDEHAIATSERTEYPGNDCRNCHNHAASGNAIRDAWPDRDNADACSTCHSGFDLSEAHTAGFNVAHTVVSESNGCAASGPGCHPSADLSEVGKPTVTENIHRDCLRCHDWRERGGDVAYDPDATSCGSGRDCHAASGDYSPKTSIHAGSGGRADGADSAHHRAGAAQGGAAYLDVASGVSTPCDECHSMALGTEHGRANSTLRSAGSENGCVRCHDHNVDVAEVVKTNWKVKATSGACDACHALATAPVPHADTDTVHDDTTLDDTGIIDPAACVESGCHATADVRVLHAEVGCTIQGCHSASGDISGAYIKSCGGLDPKTSCHTGDEHPAHAADLLGTAQGVTYSLFENTTCFGCHFTDLDTEHAKVLGSVDGGGANSCRVCHEGGVSGDNGAYASLPAVRAAIENHDRRCVACHASGDSSDGPTAVASPHRKVSGASTLPAGFVWTDPLSDWRGAFDAVTGGGHNVGLTAAQTGASTAKTFPLTSFDVSGTTYTWALPPNAGATRWLVTTALGGVPASTPSQIRHITVTCEDCHSFGGVPAGPHGANVKVNIDPAYSQTEWSDPTPAARQFQASGTDRVVCFKCHPMRASSNPTVHPGGDEVHRSHVEHADKYPLPDPLYYGQKCIDCHIRIPHAWKRPRLLVRTVVASDGVAPDTFPYVRAGHDGLVGIQLRSFTAPGELRWSACGTGGCHPGHTAARHPQPSDVPTATWWP